MKEYKPSAVEIEQGYFTDESEDGICLECKDHSSIDILIDSDGEEIGEQVSSCCGAKIWTP